MSIAILRDYEPEDATAVKNMINEAFYIYKYAQDPQLLDSALNLYLHECLAVSSYAQVAEIQGRTVGILMGRVSGMKYLPGRRKHQLQALGNLVKIALTGFKERKTLAQYFTFTRAYTRLRAKTTAPLTDEITLFAVDQAARGTGVGTLLYQEYMNVLCANGRTDFYLYTDSWCTFQFYERKGMSRAAQEVVELSFGDVTEQVDVYLYTSQV